MASIPKHRSRNLSLGSRLRRSRLHSASDGRDFIPLDHLDELLTEEEVRSELTKAGLTDQKCSPELLKYILNHAKKVFATLVVVEAPQRIEELVYEGLTDADLPLGVDWGDDNDDYDSEEPVNVRSYYLNSDTLNERTNWTAFQNWPEREADSFCELQWLFLAPVFTGKNYEYYLHKKCPLPFLDSKREIQIRFSHHSKVYNVSVHGAHLKWEQAKHFKYNSDESYVAIKELHPDATDKDGAEARTLEKLNKLDHDHLIKCIATYQQHGKYCFMFPWANGGNLRQFWVREDHIPRELDLLIWVLQQMHGLAHGIMTLHQFNNRENCRHGDLKPENILRFMSDNEPSFGRLVVTDLGSATFHKASTRSRGGTTGNGYGTMRYEAPEVVLGRSIPRSRRYDVWSVGCIFLEFLVWLLYGWDKLEAFNGGLDRYWVPDRDAVQVHPKVRECIRLIYLDPRCRKNTALGDLLRAIDTKLLVPEHGDSDGETFPTSKQRVPEHDDAGVETLASPIVINVRPATRRDYHGDILSNAENHIRADSVELDRILENIVNEAKCVRSYAFEQSDWDKAKGNTEFHEYWSSVLEMGSLWL
jgi:serine/threonine protein kinase